MKQTSKEEDIIKDMKQTLKKWEEIRRLAQIQEEVPKLVFENSHILFDTFL